MKYLITLTTLFVIGSIMGYIIEVIYKRVVSKKKWVNPGFMFGPYLPIYGFGTIILYQISEIILSRINVPILIEILIVIGVFFLSLTLLEFVAGIFFLKKFNLRLWNYSDRRFNFKGVICLRYSIYWTIIGVTYYYLLHPLFLSIVSFSLGSLITQLVLFSILGIILIDAYTSFNLKEKINKALDNLANQYAYIKELIP